MSKKNEARTVGVRQIEKNMDLSIGAPLKDIAKYKKVVEAYGNVVPAVVAPEGDMYRLIDGHARIEACTRAGIKEIPVVVAHFGNDTDSVKLSLMLSATREQGSPLSEGAMVEKLTKEHGYTLRELSKLLGRSKSWLSKRQTMARNLSQPLRDMIMTGAICTRTAEEIAKLPWDVQGVFAANAVKDGLTKDEVHGLVRQYRSPDASLEFRKRIVENPAALALAMGAKIRKTPNDMTVGARVCRTVHLAIDILGVISKLITEHDDMELEATQAHLLKLRREMQVIGMLIAAHIKAEDGEVYPGKTGGVAND